MKRKCAQARYEIILGLIVGLLVIAIFLFFFQDYFNAEEIDWQVCRESLLIRNTLPEKDLAVKIESSKSFLPLECKTQVISIDYENTAKAEKEIGETISSCWYMVGRGDYKVFPGKKAFHPIDTPCMICARIHLEDDVKDFYSEEKNLINLKRALDGQLEGYDVTIWDYLNPTDGVKAFNYFKEWGVSGFNTTFVVDWTLSKFDPEEKGVFSLPNYLYPNDGDLFIGYSEPVKQAGFSEDRIIPPYMFFLQYEDFDKLSNNWAQVVDTASWVDFTFFECENCVKVCSSIESIPS